MNISIEVEKTNYLKVGDKEIKVSSLPESLRFEVETLDRILQKRLYALQELEVCELAIKAKRIHLNQLIQNEFKLSDDTDKEDANAN